MDNGNMTRDEGKKVVRPLISVVIPVYNAADYLPTCIGSVCGQSFKNLEIILVDDGSTDESGAICDEWAGRDSRIIVVHKKNEGVAAARNEGLGIASGDLIGFVDSDDWIEPQMYEKLLQGLGNADMVCCGYVDYPLGTMERPVHKGVEPANPCGPEQAAVHIYKRNGYFTSVWNKLVRREVLTDNGDMVLMDPAFAWGEDEVWLAQVLGKCRRVAFVPEALYHWRPTPVSATRSVSVTPEQMTLISAKKRAMDILPRDPALQALVRSRMFNDCFSLKVTTYAARDREKFRTISSVLASVKPAWLRSRDVSMVRKVKVLLMELEMKAHLPGRLVQRTDDVRRYGLKR